jgi:hypothetical protein
MKELMLAAAFSVAAAPASAQGGKAHILNRLPGTPAEA